MLIALVIIGTILFATGLIALGARSCRCQVSQRNQVQARVREAERNIDRVVQNTWSQMVDEVRRHQGS